MFIVDGMLSQNTYGTMFGMDHGQTGAAIDRYIYIFINDLIECAQMQVIPSVTFVKTISRCLSPDKWEVSSLIHSVVMGRGYE